MIPLIVNAGWSSDWEGHEVGYPELGVVSLMHTTVITTKTKT